GRRCRLWFQTRPGSYNAASLIGFLKDLKKHLGGHKAILVWDGFLPDEQYEKLRDALPDCLKPLFETGYFTGVRLGKLLALRWNQVDWEQSFITLNADETKSGHSRAVPIIDGDMRSWLVWAWDHAQGAGTPHVFHN
ncbi:MAG: tyrosine-type recombinase/integrase, partial [Bryobacteraceae bacterium]